MRKAIIYCRKSTESEERQVQSIEAQIDWCREYATANSFEVVEEVIESKSAKKPGREGFNQMLALFGESKADTIICWQLNRLSRNPIDEGSIKWLTQQGIIQEIHSTDGISNGQNILLMSVHFGMATQYVIDLKKNVLRGMNQKFDKGGALGQAPTGYFNDRNTNEFGVDKEQASFVKQVFQLKVKGYSYSQISKMLYAKGFKSRTGKPKAISTLEQIIKNEFYIGIINFQGRTNSGKHKTFISKKLFDEANGTIKTQKIKPQDYGNDFIFQGIIKYKGKAMRAYKTKGNIYYREAAGVTPAFNISQNLLLSKFEVEIPKYTLPECLQDEFSEGLLKYFNDMNKGNKNSIIQTRKKIDELKEENKNVVRKNIKGSISDEVSEEIQKENLLQIKDLEEQLGEFSKVDELIDQEIVELFKMFTQSEKVWKNGNLSVKAMLLKMLLVELSFDNKKQLKVENTKLFRVIREVNFPLWQAH